jgi:hypothetical protein
MPFSTACSTTLSNFEAGLNYKDVSDPAVMVSFPVVDDPDGASLVAWTTTPWTLPSNLALCVHPEFDYVRVKSSTNGAVLIVAAARLHFLPGASPKKRAKKGASVPPLPPLVAVSSTELSSACVTLHYNHSRRHTDRRQIAVPAMRTIHTHFPTLLPWSLYVVTHMHVADALPMHMCLCLSQLRWLWAFLKDSSRLSAPQSASSSLHACLSSIIHYAACAEFPPLLLPTTLHYRALWLPTHSQSR